MPELSYSSVWCALSGICGSAGIPESIDQVLQFLNGNYDLILGDLQRKMEEASEAMEYERAIEYRDLLQSVQKIAQKQKITDTAGDDRDIVAMAKDLEDAVVQVFFVRNGRLIGRDHFFLRLTGEETKSEILSSFIKSVLCRYTVSARRN